MGDIEGILATVTLYVDWVSTDESSVRTVCGDSIPAEWMTHHDDVLAGDQMVRGRYEPIHRARHTTRSAFDGRGFGNGERAAQDP